MILDMTTDGNSMESRRVYLGRVTRWRRETLIFEPIETEIFLISRGHGSHRHLFSFRKAYPKAALPAGL